MRLTRLHAALSDETRLRILNLLSRGPLCVCHLMSVLDEPQVKISKHLAVLREAGLLESHRHGHWMIYRFVEPPPEFLRVNLTLFADEPVLKTDAEALRRHLARLDDDSPVCRGETDTDAR